MDKRQPSPALKQHSLRGLAVAALSLVLVIMCIVMAVRALDPSGVYVFDYEKSPDGVINRGKNTEIRLLDDDVAIMYFDGKDGESIRGTWEKDGSEIVIRYDDFYDKAVYEWDGDYLIGREDGTVTYYRKVD